MMFDNLPKKNELNFMLYEYNQQKYVWHTSNLTSRLAIHVSLYINQSSICTSQEMFKNENYNCIVLEDNLENKMQTMKREAFYMSAFKHRL
jgi:hypothetical protein